MCMDFPLFLLMRNQKSENSTKAPEIKMEKKLLGISINQLTVDHNKMYAIL